VVWFQLLDQNNLSFLFVCPACGHNSSYCTDVPFHKHRGGTLWHQCVACGSFFESGAYDKQKQALHTQNTTYGRLDLGKEVNEFKTRMYRSVLTLLEKYCPPPAVLLDTGCSFGGFLRQARNAGYDVFGFDILPQAVEYTHSLGIAAEVSFSIRDVKTIADGTLDIVTCLDINYYWPNQPSELQHVFGKLKPGGYLALRVPVKSWMCSLGLAIYRIAPSTGGKILMAAVNDHRFSMPVRSLLKVIRSCGFDVVYASPRGAIYSYKTRPFVKLAFALGFLVWMTTGMFVAPGALVLARKLPKSVPAFES
jgi:SAM-dependent methyltransferase